MKAILKSKGFREVLMFAGLLSTVLLISSLLGDTAMATGLINPEDQPDALRDATGGQGSIRALILTILNFGLGFLGLFAVVMVIYGGFLYLSAAGNEENAKKGKTVILYAIIGIIVIFASFALVNTVLQAGLGEGATG